MSGPLRNATSLTGGEAIVESLIANRVETLFGLPGAQMYPLFDALHRHSDKIRTIGARHEQACAYMAFGYARSTGRPGVFSVVPGPGVLNTLAALSTAWGSSTPVLCVTGQVPTQFIGKGRGHLHEIPDQRATMRTICKWAERIERIADAPAVVNEAFRQMLSGRPGPVSIEMAWDVMAARDDVELLPAARLDTPPAPARDEIARAAEILSRASRPMIFVGSGAQHAAAEVRALAEALGAPVTAFRGGRGIMPEDHPLGISSYAAYKLWPDTDAVIGIGTRLELPYMRWAHMMTLIDAPEAPPHVIRIDIDPKEMKRLRPHVGIVADSADGARALLAALDSKRPKSDPAPIAKAKADAAAAVSVVKPHVEYLEVIREALGRDGIFVDELCQTGFASYFAYPVHEPHTYISGGFQGTLGGGFQTALGVKAAHPGKKVVSIAGDGGFMFGVQELATAVQYGIGLVTIVFNNDAYGNVLRDQDKGFGGRIIGSELVNPDFVALAKAFGIAGHRVSSPQELAPVLARALANDAPALIEVTVDRADEVSPWPFIHPKMARRGA